MRQPWASVDRWGPLAVSLLTFLAFVGHAWKTGERIAALEGRVTEISRNQDEALMLRERAKTLEDRLLKAEELIALQSVYNGTYDRKIVELQLRVNGKGD